MSTIKFFTKESSQRRTLKHSWICSTKNKSGWIDFLEYADCIAVNIQKNLAETEGITDLLKNNSTKEDAINLLSIKLGLKPDFLKDFIDDFPEILNN